MLYVYNVTTYQFSVLAEQHYSSKVDGNESFAGVFCKDWEERNHFKSEMITKVITMYSKGDMNCLYQTKQRPGQEKGMVINIFDQLIWILVARQ